MTYTPKNFQKIVPNKISNGEEKIQPSIVNKTKVIKKKLLLLLPPPPPPPVKNRVKARIIPS